MATKNISTNVSALKVSKGVHDIPDSINVYEDTSEDDTYVDPKEERAFVWRLDCFFLVVGFLGYTFKYLDQTNIVSESPRELRLPGLISDQSNAYVSGMKEDLNLYGNQLNYFTTYFKYDLRNF